MGGDGNGVDGGVGVERPQRVQDERPMAVYVVMRIGAVRQHGVRPRAHRDLRQPLAVDQRDLGVGLADVDHGDVAGWRAAHGIWKTVSSGTATGSLSGLVSMMSAI